MNEAIYFGTYLGKLAAYKYSQSVVGNMGAPRLPVRPRVIPGYPNSGPGVDRPIIPGVPNNAQTPPPIIPPAQPSISPHPPGSMTQPYPVEQTALDDAARANQAATMRSLGRSIPSLANTRP